LSGWAAEPAGATAHPLTRSPARFLKAMRALAPDSKDWG